MIRDPELIEKRMSSKLNPRLKEADTLTQEGRQTESIKRLWILALSKKKKPESFKL
jgi:hypothetical protein